LNALLVKEMMARADDERSLTNGVEGDFGFTGLYAFKHACWKAL
jgi:hypothetical protein